MHFQDFQIINKDVFDGLASIDTESVNTCITSPPYWGIRDFESDKQIGNESTVQSYTDTVVRVFQEVRRVLRDDGTLWINLGDGYYSNNRTENQSRKSLIGIPWRIAFAMQSDGWILRQEIIWNKPNAMPESARDRPTRCHEQIFLLSKKDQYYFDQKAIMEPVTGNAHSRGSGLNPKAVKNTGVGWGYGNRKNKKPRCKQNESFSSAISNKILDVRNKRSVWTIHTKGCSDDHSASFPEELIIPCILAGCPIGGVVLDPFCGRGTTGIASVRRGRNFIGIEIVKKWAELSERNIMNARIQLPLKGLE